MPHLVYVRNCLSSTGMSANLVYDEAGGKPVLGEADRRAGVLDWHLVTAGDAGLSLSFLCRLYPRRASVTERAA